MTEQALAKKFSYWLKQQDGVYYLKVHGHSAQRKGVPDYWVVVRSASIQIELKRPGDAPIGTPLQEHELRKHDAAGGNSFVATSFEACTAVIDFYREIEDAPERVQDAFKSGTLREVFDDK